MSAAPTLRATLVALLGAAAIALTLSIAAGRPAADIAMAPGMAVSGASGGLTLEALDLIAEPGALGRAEDLARFYARQGRLAAILAEDEVSVSAGDRARTLAPAPRGIWSLPAAFWVQAAVGLGALAISGWVWALRGRDLAARLFALSGVATLAFTLSAAVYSTRFLALPADLFARLSALNALGASLFGVAMIALFCVYPVRLPGWRGLIAASAGAFGVWTLASLAGLLPPWAGVNLITLVEMACICGAIVAQVFATRGKPEARAVLAWFGLSVLIGAGAFIVLNAAPLVLGAQAAISQGYAFLFFLVIYLGLAAGLFRFRLFELGDWAFRILFYLVAAALLIALDAVLILALSLERMPALGVSLLAVAFLYLPLRDVLARRFQRADEPDREALFGEVVSVALAPPGAGQEDRWRALLRRVFDPLRLEVAPGVAEPEILDNGLALVLPGVDAAPALRMEHAHGGRRLFSPRDLARARELVAILSHALESRRAFEQGAAAERGRIARDMHDNIGAQLLSALHSRDPERKNTTIRETLSDLRDIINNAGQPGLSLAETLADLRMETTERLAAAEVTLRWTASSEGEPNLSPHAAHALRSLVRESVSNVLKHAGAEEVRIDILQDGRDVSIAVADDGAGFDLESTASGSGLSNMRSRMDALGGALDIGSGPEGTRVSARFPLRKGEKAA